MNKKRKNFLIIYFIIIIISLVLIMFVIPDSFFMKKYEDIKLPTAEKLPKKEFTDYEIQKEHILKKKFDYEYDLLDSMSSTSYTYECSGSIDETIESGSCILPEKVSYTEKNKQEVFKNIDINNLDVEYIFNMIKDVEPVETKYQTLREYNYNVKIKDLETEIIVHTDLDEITKIYISNAYMTYILKYSNMSY